MELIKSINNKYLIISLLMYLIVLPGLELRISPVYILHVFTVIIYFLVLQNQIYKNVNLYTKRRLIKIIFFYSFFYILLYNIVSFVYNNNLFVFSASDAVLYHEESLRIASGQYMKRIADFTYRYSIGDTGIILVISSLYVVYASNLILNTLYLLLSLFSGIGIFNIGKQLMPTKYAFISSITFSLSSYFLWFNSSGLKESIMVFLIIYSFLYYYRFIKLQKLKHLILMALFMVAIMLFRPATMLLIMGAIFIGNLLGRKRKKGNWFLIILLFLVLSLLSSYILVISNRFLGDSVSGMLYSKDITGMIKGGIGFTYFVNILAGLIGPLPTLLPDINSKMALSFFAPGLIYKTLISVPFLFGVFYIFKRKRRLFYPILIFTLLKIFSLVFILEALELRKSITHFPFIYLIAFGFISMCSDAEFLSVRRKIIIIKSFNISFYIIFFLLIFWNLVR